MKKEKKGGGVSKGLENLYLAAIKKNPMLKRHQKIVN